MDTEEKKLLRKNLELTEENNRLLRKMRRSSRYWTVVQLLWWAVIIGIPVYLYFTFFEPVVADLQSAYENLQTGVGGLQEIPESFRGALEKLPSLPQ